MIENEKYVSSLQYLTLFALKEAEDYFSHNMLFFLIDINLKLKNQVMFP